MKNLQINKLYSGGLITNYYCTSECRHCLYGCSPSWDKEYISVENAEEFISIIRKMNCNNIHIGGGEPFLNFDQLVKVIRIAHKSGVNIEYIETNASWINKDEDTLEKLEILFNNYTDIINSRNGPDIPA